MAGVEDREGGTRRTTIAAKDAQASAAEQQYTASMSNSNTRSAPSPPERVNQSISEAQSNGGKDRLQQTQAGDDTRDGVKNSNLQQREGSGIADVTGRSGSNGGSNSREPTTGSSRPGGEGTASSSKDKDKDKDSKSASSKGAKKSKKSKTKTSTENSGSKTAATADKDNDKSKKGKSGGKSGKRKSSSGPGSPSAASKSGDKKWTAAAKKDGGASATGTRSATDKSKPDTKDSSRDEGSRTSRSRGRNRSRGRGRSSRDRSRDSRSFSSSRSWSSRSRSYSSSRSRRRDSRSRSDSRSGSRGRDSRTRKSSRDRDRSSRRGRSRDRSRDRERDRDRSGRGDYRERERRGRGRGRGYERHHDGGRRGDRERDRQGGGRGTGGRGIGWNRERSHRDLDLASLAAPKATSPGVLVAAEGDDNAKVEGAKDDAPTAKVGKGGAKDGLGEEATNEAASASNKVANVSDSVLPARGGKEQHQRAGSKDGGSSSKDNREREEGSNGNGRHRGRGDQDSRGGDSKRGDYGDDRHRRHGRDRQNLEQDQDAPPYHGRYRGGDKDGNEQQPDGGHRPFRRDSRGGDGNRTSNYSRNDSQQHRHNSREHSHHHRPGKAEHNRDYTQHILRPEEDKANDNNNKSDGPNHTHRDNTDTNNGSLHRDREHRSLSGRGGPDRGVPPHFRGDRDRGWAPGAPDRGIRDSERWRPDREPSEAGGAGPLDRWRPDIEGNDPREMGGSRHVYRGIGGGRGGGDDGWEPRGRGMDGPGGREPGPRGRGPLPMREEGGGRGGGRDGPWNGPPFPGDGYPQNDGGMAPLMRQPQQEEGPGAFNGREFGGDDRGRSAERGFPAMREKRRRSGSREVGPRGIDRDNVMDNRNYRDRMDNMDGQGSAVVDAVGGAGTGTLGALAGGFGYSPAKRLRGDEPPYGGPPGERGDIVDESDIRRPPVMGPGPGPGPDPGADRRGVELDPRGLEPRGGDPGIQQPGRGFGGLPGRGFGFGGPGRAGVGMQGRGGGAGRGRGLGGFGRGVHDLPPPEFQRRDGFSGPPGGPDQNRRTAAAAAGGSGPVGRLFVDHLTGPPGRGGPGPGRGGAGGGVGPGGAVPWRNRPIDFQGRGPPGSGPPRGPSGGLLPDPSSHVGVRGPEGAEMGPSSSGPMMDGKGMDRRDRMVGGRGDRGGMGVGRDGSLGRRGVEGREGFERGGRGGGEPGDFSGVGNRGPRGPGGRSSPFLDAPPGMGQPLDRNGAGMIGGGVGEGPPGPGLRGSEPPIVGLDRGAVISNNRIGGGPIGPGGVLDQRNGSAGGIPIQGRGGSRPPPGIWGPRGPPPSGHPAWNDSQFIRELEQRYQQEQQQQQSNGAGGVKGRGPDGHGPSPPPPWTMDGDGPPGGSMRGRPRAGPGPPRGFIQGPGVGPLGVHRSAPRGIGPGGEHGRGDVIGPGGGRGAPLPGLNGRLPGVEEQGAWRPNREAPWQNGGGRGPGFGPGPGQPPRGLPMWELGPPGGGGEGRMGPDGRVQQRNWDHGGRFPRSDSRDRGWDSTVPGGGVRPQEGGPAGSADDSNIGDHSNFDNNFQRPPGRSRSRSDTQSRGGMGDGRDMGRPGYGHERGDGWGPPGRGPPGMQMHEDNRGWPPVEHHRHPPGLQFRGEPTGPPGVRAYSGMDPFGLPPESSGVDGDPAFAREGQGELGGGMGGAHGGTSGPQEDDPTVLAVAANLAPVCVSRRLLSSSAYQQLALARQAGDAVRAGLTFEAEEVDHDDEEQDDAWLVGGGLDIVGSAGGVKEEGSGARDDDVLKGMEIDGISSELPGTAAASATDSETAAALTDKPAAEEDDLYEDLYGGLDDDGTIGADGKTTGSTFSLRRNSNGGGDGNGRAGGGVDGEHGGGKSGESREGASGLGVVGKGGRGGNEDVSTRSVMNALKRLEGPMFIPTRAEEHALYDMQSLAAGGLPSSAAEFAQEMLATLSA